jgi:CRP/FNR family cyclic AMP-dependent transcriptional regulator
MRGTRRQPAHAKALLAGAGTTSQYPEKEAVSLQGAAADTIFYVREGIVMLSVRSKGRRSAVVAIVGAGNFFNEFCVLGQARCSSTATAITPSAILAIKSETMLRLLRGNNDVSAFFVSCLLSSAMQIREDLVDVLVSSSEQRLARTLLRLARLCTKGQRGTRIPSISQQVLADMVGTTRSRVNFFMNRFKKRGFIFRNGTLELHSSLNTVLLRS